MAENSPAPTQLILDDHPALGRISVDMEAFFEFSFWIAEELEDLKASWLHSEAQASRSARQHRADAIRNDRREAR